MLYVTQSVYTYRGAGFEERVEDGLSMLVDEEGVDRAPLMATQEVLYLLQGGVYPHYTYGPAHTVRSSQLP